MEPPGSLDKKVKLSDTAQNWDQQDPVWIPERLTRRCNKQDEASDHVPVDDDDPDVPAADPRQ